MNERPRTLPIHRSLIRPILLMGAERELILSTGVIAAVLILSLARPLFAIIGLIFWCVSLAALQRLAKADPLFSRVYLRHVRYRGYYEAQSRAAAPPVLAREQLSC